MGKLSRRRELLLEREIIFQSIDKSQYMRDCREKTKTNNNANREKYDDEEETHTHRE